MFWESGYRREITETLKRLLELDAGNEPSLERARALGTGGFLLWSLNDLSEARAYLEESIEIAGKLGNAVALAWSYGYLGWTFASLGEYDAARIALERSVQIARQAGGEGKHAAGNAMSFLGDIPYWQGNLPEARRLYEEAISFVRQVNNMNTLTYPLRRLAYIALREGDFVQAAELFGESLEMNLQLGHVQGSVACLAGFAAINFGKGRRDRAATLYGAVEGLLERFGGPFFFADTVEYQRSAANLKNTFTGKGFTVAWTKGRGMTLEQAVGFALTET
jgi:tetratricopeptide (TPR) repeat protein